MNRSPRPDILDLQLQRSSTLTRARSQSIGSSDKPLSSNGSSVYSVNSIFINVSPEPAYVAASAATGIVTGNHENFLHGDDDTSNATPTIPVTPASLKLINQFLDFLLYSFLSAAKSTSLKALRPAVSEVLRNRLAKEAVTGADQELSWCLGEEEGDDDFDGMNEVLGNTQWDLDIVWKKTRLRCMVYSSLGDIEEEDEDIYLGYDNLEGIVGSQQYEQNSVIPGVVSPAVAIWLTAVLEFMGEQTLLVAGHAAINRFSQRVAIVGDVDNPDDATCTIEKERPMVEELDTEKVALNSSLGRLWRQWRKCSRGKGHHSTLSQRIERSASQMSCRSMLVGYKNPHVGTRGVSEKVVTIDKGPGLNAEEQLKETSPAIDEGSLGAVMTPSKFDIGSGYQFSGIADYSSKQRPQSLVLLPSTTTEAPFVISRSSLKQRRSLPAIVRSEFPDPIIEGVPDTQEPGIEFEGIDEEPFMTTPSSDTSAFETVEPASKKPDLQEQTCFHTQKQTEESVAVGEILAIANTSKNIESKDPNNETEIPKTAIPPKDETPEVTLLPQASDGGGEQGLYEGDKRTSVIGSAHTSDILVPPPTSQPSLHKKDDHPKKNLGEEPHVGCAPRTIDQQKFERFIPRRPAELVEIRNSGRVSTFQEQRAADRRPSATTLAELYDSDDDSSITTSHKYFEGGRWTPGGTSQTAVDYFAHTNKTSSTSSKYSQQSQLSDRKLGQLTLIQLPGSTTSLPVERGVRAWTPPQTPNKSRRSSFGKSQRPVTSHSSTSQSSTKFASLDDKERIFEELISSGPIHLTITPDPLRRMEAEEKPHTGTSDLADFFLKTGPGGKEVRAAPPSRSGNSSRPSTARAIPIIPKTPSVEDTVSHTQPTSASPAETGPQAPAAPVPSPQPSGHCPSIRRTSESRSEYAPLKVELIPMSPSDITGIPAVLRQNRSESLRSRPTNRLVARDASGFTTSESTSALADFFRNTTPPVHIDGQVTQHRISRSVAPFRNTMDSDQFELPEVESRRVASNETSPSELSFFTSAAVLPESYQSSLSSSTALLRSNSKKQHGYGAVNSVPEAKRKQRRIRDPYDPYGIGIGIGNLDGEEDMEALNLIIPKRKDDENLFDFGQNISSSPISPQGNDEMKMVQKKNSSVSLIGRFGRNNRKNSITSNADRFSLPPVPQLPGGYKHTPFIQEDSRHIPGEEQRLPSRLNIDSPATPRFGNRQQARGVVQAKGPRVERGDTDTLIDFLKFSEPPPSALIQHAPTLKEDTGAMAKFKNFTFSRKSKRNEVC